MMSGKLTYQTFWVVWNPDGRSPMFKHDGLLAAQAEAERLARENPAQTFVVLESVCARRVDDMLRIDMRPDCDIPF